MFFPRAHPLHIVLCFELRLGVLVFIFSTFRSELNPKCPSLLFHTLLGFITLILRALFWILHSLHKILSLVHMIMALFRFKILGQYKNLSLVKVTWNPSSAYLEIEIRFLFMTVTNITSFNFSVTPVLNYI